ncbi:MAG: ABC transporter ATP-binding protein [Erysipelotrichaceae bacterium]|nr:ABC transporter ATP-binding protein [Erysipelotrichaceae bacterium]
MSDRENEIQKDKQEGAFATLATLRERWKNGTFGEIIEDWKWIFSYSARYKWAIAFYTILGIFSTTLGLVASIASKYMIDIITGDRIDQLPQLIIIMVGSALFSLFFSNYIGRLSLKIGIKIGNEIQADIFEKIMDAEWLEISKYTNGDILNRFSNDVGVISSNAISWLPNIVIALYRFLATFIVIWHYNKLMSVLAFATAPMMLLMSKFVVPMQRTFRKKLQEMSSKVMTFEVETFYNMDTIKSFGISDQYNGKLRMWQERLKKVNLDFNMFSIKTNVFMSICGMIVQYVAFGYCLYLKWTGQITYGTMTLFLEQRASLAGAFNSVIGIIPSFLNSSVSAHRIKELAFLPKEEHIPESAELNELARNGFKVQMDDVTFAYVDDKNVIVDSNFIASPGEVVALVGPSGEGKTTTIRLILGLVHPQKGRVFIESYGGRRIDCNADTRYLFSYVPQGNTILSGTIAENLQMGKEDATEEEMIQALKDACAWDFVQNLPETVNNSVGERGRGLSEGQSQRIAIARAILRNAPILLLDEATSALDVTTERQVLRNIMENHPDKTCIVTTHRPSVLNISERVYRVMDKKMTELSEEESSRMAMDF